MKVYNVLYILVALIVLCNIHLADARYLVDLSATDPDNFQSIYPVQSMCYDSAKDLIYTGGSLGRFGVYNRTSNVWTNLSYTDTDNWMGTTYVNALAYNNYNGLIYTGAGSSSGGSGKFGVYNITSNVWTNISNTDTGNWAGQSRIYSLAFDNNTRLLWTGLNDSKIGIYNYTSNVWTNLTYINTTQSIYGMAYDYKQRLMYVGSHDSFGYYNTTTNTYTSLSAGLPASWGGVYDVYYDDTNNLIYCSGYDGGTFGVYNKTSNLIYDYSETDENNFIASSSWVWDIVYSPSNNLVYLGIDNGKFGAYNITSNVTYNLSGIDYNNFIGTNKTYSLLYNNELLYLGAANGIFGVLYTTDYKINNITYTNNVVETTANTFKLYLSYDPVYYNYVSSDIIYNNTIYSTTDNGYDGLAIFTADVNAPAISANTNISFYFNLTLQNTSGSLIYIQTSIYNQSVNTLTPPSVSSTPCSEIAYNFSFKTENNQTIINTTIEYNIKYSKSLGGTTKSIYGQVTDTKNLYVCINSTISSSWYLYDSSIYYGLTNYNSRRYYIYDGHLITNSTQNVLLYLLPSTLGEVIDLSVQDNAQTPYDNYYVSLLRWYPEYNEYRIVDMVNTNAYGNSVIDVVLESVDYRLGVYQHDGTLVYLDNPTRMSCVITPCIYTLIVIPSIEDFTSFLTIDYTLEYDDTLGVWTFTYSDSSQLTSLMNMTIYRDTGVSSIPICTITSSGYVGVMQCDTSAYTTGTQRAVVYRAASPPILIAQKIIGLVNESFRTTLGLFFMALSAIAIIAGYMLGASFIGTIIGSILALLTAFFLGTITWGIVAGFIILAIIVNHFLEK